MMKDNLRELEAAGGGSPGGRPVGAGLAVWDWPPLPRVAHQEDEMSGAPAHLYPENNKTSAQGWANVARRWPSPERTVNNEH